MKEMDYDLFSKRINEILLNTSEEEIRAWIEYDRRMIEEEKNKKTMNIEQLQQQENLNIFDAGGIKKFNVTVSVSGGEVIFSGIIESDNLINAADRAFSIIGVEKITLYDDVEVTIIEIK